MDKKRVRCTNFTSQEMDVLLGLVERHKNVIECKKTDAVSNKEKDYEWKIVCDNFNAMVGSGRTIKQLRLKWDSLKKTTKKNYSTYKNSLYKTGGGPSNSVLSTWEERVLAIIGMSATGVDCSFDCDSIIEKNEVTPGTSNSNFTNTEFEFPTEEISKHSEVEIDSQPVLLETQIHFSGDEPVFEGNSKENEPGTWKQWNPLLLRKPLHPALTEGIVEKDEKAGISQPSTTPVRTILQQRKNRSTAKRKFPGTTNGTSKYDMLLEKKLELVSLQIELLKQEHEAREKRNAEQHNLEMELLKKQLQM